MNSEEDLSLLMLKAAWAAYDKAMEAWLVANEGQMPPPPPRIARPSQEQGR